MLDTSGARKGTRVTDKQQRWGYPPVEGQRGLAGVAGAHEVRQQRRVEVILC